jgi:hypothetical protein
MSYSLNTRSRVINSPEDTPGTGVKPGRKEGNAAGYTVQEVELCGGGRRHQKRPLARQPDDGAKMTHLLVADSSQVCIGSKVEKLTDLAISDRIAYKR